MPSLKSWITVSEQVISKVLGECYFPLPKWACSAFCAAMWVASFPSTDCLQRNTNKNWQGKRGTEAEYSSYMWTPCHNWRVMCFRVWCCEQVFCRAIAGSGCSQSPRWAGGLHLPLKVRKMVGAPAKWTVSVRPPLVSVCGRCSYTSACRREGIRLVYSLKTLDCPK